MAIVAVGTDMCAESLRRAMLPIALAILLEAPAASAQAPPAPEPSGAPFTDAGAPPFTPPAPSAAPAPAQPAPGAAPPASPPPTASAPPSATPPPPALAPAVAPVAAPPERPRDPRVADAHADRLVILPTAYTHPEGTVYISTLELAFEQIGYAFSDKSQITLTAAPPLGQERIVLADVSLKTQFVHDGPVRAAAIGSVSGLLGLNEGNALLGRVGGALQLCFDEPCESSVTMAATALFAGPAVLVLSGAGVNWRLSSWAALVLEVDTLVPLGREAGPYNAIIVLPTFRFPFRTWALDLGVARALDVDQNVGLIPTIAFTYRFLR